MVGTSARELPDIAIVMYTLNLDVCDDARAAGALACVAKDAPYELLLRAIRAARARAVPV
jgi:hypothetical protein